MINFHFQTDKDCPVIQHVFAFTFTKEAEMYIPVGSLFKGQLFILFCCSLDPLPTVTSGWKVNYYNYSRAIR